MVERPRLLVAGLVVLVGVALFAVGSGPGTLTGTVAPNQVPGVDVTAAPSDGADGTVTVRYTDTGGWEAATLTVDWNASLTVVDGDPRLETVGDSVVLGETAGAGTTPVEVTVTATPDGQATVIYRKDHRI